MLVRMSATFPLFHLYGDPPDEQAFDFIHVETIVSRSALHDWLIRAHRHRNLFQFLFIASGGGEMLLESATLPFRAPCIVVVGPNVAHGFRFNPGVTNGWIVSFTEDVAAAMGERSGEAVAQLRAIAMQPRIPLNSAEDARRMADLCGNLVQEERLAREGHRVAMRALLALIAVEIGRFAASRARTGRITLTSANATVETLQRLVEEHFRSERQIGFYADMLAMTPDRLNDHVKRATGVTAGHLIRRRILTEAKRELIFTNRAIHEIAFNLGFTDPSHFARFFRKQTGMTPNDFRAGQESGEQESVEQERGGQGAGR
jgi:AraC family transcriptional activator of pobA